MDAVDIQEIDSRRDVSLNDFCSDGFNGTATVYEIKATSLGIEGRYFSSNAGGGCREAAQFSAVLQ